MLVSPNASLHKWQQALAPGWLPYMVPQNWIQARTLVNFIKKWPKVRLDLDRLRPCHWEIYIDDLPFVPDSHSD